ncbi:hypothetical protein BC936DRAFT_145935, partial [Jimgerdemannia flammicorona]
LVSYNDDNNDNDDKPNQKVTGLAGLLSYGGDDGKDEDEEMENREASQPLTKAIIHKVADTTPRKLTLPTHLRPLTSLKNSPSLMNLVQL